MSAQMSICVYCGSKDGADPAFAQAAEDLGRGLAEQNMRLVYGAGDVGLMGRVARAAQKAGRAIYDLAQQHERLAGMGTTLTSMMFHEGRVHLAHVGDSRIYLTRQSQCHQLTEDHSLMNELIRRGTRR